MTVIMIFLVIFGGALASYGEEPGKSKGNEELIKKVDEFEKKTDPYRKLDSQTLIKILKDKNRDLEEDRTHALKVINERHNPNLGGKPDDKVIKGLSEILLDPDKRDTKRYPWQSGRTIGDQEFLRWLVVKSLGEIGGLSVVPTFIKVLDDESPTVVWETASNLGHFKDSKALPHLLRALQRRKSPEWKKQLNVVPTSEEFTAITSIMYALTKIKGMEKEKVRAFLEIVEDEELSWEKYDDIKFNAIADLGEMGKDAPEAVEPLIKAFPKVKIRSTRAGIIDSLGKIGDKRAVDFLINVLNKNREDGFITMTAADALAEMGDRRAVKPLEEAIRRGDKILNKYLKKSYKKLTGKEYQEK